MKWRSSVKALWKCYRCSTHRWQSWRSCLQSCCGTAGKWSWDASTSLCKHQSWSLSFGSTPTVGGARPHTLPSLWTLSTHWWTMCRISPYCSCLALAQPGTWVCTGQPHRLHKMHLKRPQWSHWSIEDRTTQRKGWSSWSYSVLVRCLSRCGKVSWFLHGPLVSAKAALPRVGRGSRFKEPAGPSTHGIAWRSLQWPTCLSAL